MRNEFINTLYKLAQKDKRIVLLTADLGFSVIEKFAKDFPDRFYNIGIAEQNMIGVATGLAESGFIPFCYSTAPFVLLRPYEFIKNGPVLHNLKVRIIGIGSGFQMDMGYTHYCLEDVALTRVFPNLKSFSPINNANTSDMLCKTYNLDGPIYYRTGKNAISLSENIIKSYNEEGMETLHENYENKTCVIALGSSVEEGIIALNQVNKSINLYSLTHINPSPEDKIKEILLKHKHVITLEAHYINGGIGSMISEIIAQNQINCKITRLAVSKQIEGKFGNNNFMHQKYNISSEDIINCCLKK